MSSRRESASGELAWSWVQGPRERLLIAATLRGLCFLALDPTDAVVRLERWASRSLPGASSRPAGSPVLDRTRQQLEEYFAGKRRGFDVPLDLHGTPFQRAVWDEFLAIPHGTTRTYAELATRLARPGATRAVGLAAGRNPVPILVPCHRLVASRGLGGFSAGIASKRTLLALEGVRMEHQGRLDLATDRFA